MNNATENEKTAKKTALVNVVFNALLSVFKLFFGLFSKSSALVSDAVNSAGDVFSTFIAAIGIKLACKATDEDHQYGHERLECIAALILATILATTGAGIGLSGISTIVSGDIDKIAVPGKAALVAAAICVIAKEIMYRYTRNAAKKVKSDALMSVAWDHRSDALSSIGSFLGILGAIIGFPILDPLASIIICLFILKAALDIYRDAVSKLTDKAADKQTAAKIRKTVMQNEEVICIDVLKTRLFGAKIYVDIEIAVDGRLPLRDAHQIAQSVHDSIEREFPDVKHCMVHVNPFGEKENDG